MPSGPATRPVKTAAQLCLLAPLPRHCQINRKPELIERLVNDSKQRPIPKINRKLLGTPSARLMVFTADQSQSTNHPKINRHTFLLEIAVSHRKQSSSQNLLASKMPFFPHPPKPPLAMLQCPPKRAVFSSTSLASSASFASRPRHALNSPFRPNPRGLTCS